MKFLILGCNGMAGHIISLYLKEQGYEVIGFARKRSKFIHTIIGDAFDEIMLQDIIRNGNYDSVVNCIGLLNEEAEMHKTEAVFLNAYLPHFLEAITDETKIQIIHISTDCVFSGKRGQYKESDIRDGESFYGRTKALGELENEKDVTVRTSIIGPDLHPNGIGLLNWFMQQNKRVKGYKKAIWTGQTNLQMAKTIEYLAVQRIHGLYNIVPQESISKYDILILFNKYLRVHPIDIILDENYKLDKSLKRTKFEQFNYKIPGYEEQIADLGNWMWKHKELYPHYNIKIY